MALMRSRCPFWMLTIVAGALSAGSLPAWGSQPSEVSNQGQAGTTLKVEGLSASIGEDSPRVLFILPWQAPTLPRRPREALPAKFPDLIEKVDPVAGERHRQFRDSLNPQMLSPNAGITTSTQ